jgi:copper transport protein
MIRGIRPTARRAAAFLAVAGIVIVATAGAAGAHAVLEGASPSPSTTISRAPRQISLSFSEGVDMRADGIRLFDDGMRRVDIGAPKHPGGHRNQVVATVPKLARGLYTVAWRAVSADSHPVEGAFTFGIGVNATGKAAADRTALAQAGQKSDRTVGVLLGVMRFGVFVGLAMVLGGAAFVAFLWPSGRSSVKTRQFLLSGLEVSFLCTVGGFLLQGPYTSGGGLGDVFSGDQISAVWDTRYGKVYVLRLVLLVIMGVLLRLALRKGPRSRAEVTGVTIVGIALAATPALAGHASTGRWVALAVPLDVVHVLAMAVWFGGLMCLVLARNDDVAFSEVAERFSGVALASVVVIVVTGSVQALRQLEPFSALWSSTYGALLIAKVVAFGAILLIAAWSRRLVHGRLWHFSTAPRADEVEVITHTTEVDTLTDASGSVATLVREETSTTTTVRPHRLTRAVLGELVFAAVVLALTSILVNTAPPVSSQGPQPVNDVTIGTGATRFETFFGPAKVGLPNQMHVTAVGSNGLPRPVVDMQATLENPGKDVPPISIPLKKFPNATGHYIASGIRVPPGVWKLTVTAFVTDVDSVTATTTIRVA